MHDTLVVTADQSRFCLQLHKNRKLWVLYKKMMTSFSYCIVLIGLSADTSCDIYHITCNRKLICTANRNVPNHSVVKVE